MLVSPHYGGIDHHVFVIVIARQQLKNALENSALRPSAKALMDDLAITETFGEVTPRNTRPISVQDSLDEQPIIRRRASDMAVAAGQKILDPIPLIVA
jgi:hypothetical protein